MGELVLDCELSGRPNFFHCLQYRGITQTSEQILSSFKLFYTFVFVAFKNLSTSAPQVLMLQCPVISAPVHRPQHTEPQASFPGPATQVN